MTRPRIALVRKLSFLLTGCLFLSTFGCQKNDETMPTTTDMNTIAESFVKLVLAVGQHDRDYVDAYFGPEEWKTEAETAALELPEIRQQAIELLQDLEAVSPENEDSLEARRRVHLSTTVTSLIAKVDLLSGVRMSFDEESKALYDAVAPTYSAEHFQQILDRLDQLLPGEGSITDRYDGFLQAFVIPPDKLDVVFAAAVDACRERTLQYMDLPAEESFEIEYVSDKSWSGYNWYKGDYHSLIQVNTDLPIRIDRALDLACHEGYPGHHVYNLLLERDLLRSRDWIEYSVYPLFSPRSLLAEGTANYGIDVAFPAAMRVQFERDNLFPLAGIEPDQAELYYKVQELVGQLGFARNEAARGYLNGDMDAETAVEWLMAYSLMARERAEQSLSFIEQYRAYVINYNHGQALVRNYVERMGGTADDQDLRWQLFTDLLSNPVLPSDLQ